MPKGYDHQEIEKRAQAKWAELDLYTTDLKNTEKDPYYLLFEFPYPSGDLHIGHWYAFAVTDIYARYLRMKGKNVLFPIGFDSFGLPAENAAMKNGADPKQWTYDNMDRMRTQIKSMGTSVDWSKEIVTSDPEYYKWTQWLFAKLFEHNLAERREAPVKWCPKDQTVLANEQVVDGKCERCGTEVEEKRLTQWFMKITEYAERLLADLDALPWREEIKEAQRAWIGKSEGAKLKFPITTGGKTFVLLHGFKGSPEEGSFPWIKAQLEAAGNHVVVPTLPHADKPTEEEWVEAAMNAAVYDENTILLGWSLGAVTVLKVLEKLTTPIRKAILVGGFIDPEFKDNSRNFEKTFDWNFDWKKIHANVKEITGLHDVNDPAVSAEQADRLEKAGEIILRRLAAESGHFDARQEPSMLHALTEGSADYTIEVFTTRPDTIFGATYVVLAPEHKLLNELLELLENETDVAAYIEITKKKTERERSENKEKTGVRLEGISAINPATQELIPVYVADYVLGSYGTGAVMAVPAHDERDYEFAKRHALPIKQVVEPKFIADQNGDAALVPGLELIKRDCVCVVVRNPKDNTYLCTSWKAVHMHGLVTGGIDESEDIVEAARREVYEETGYKNLRYIERPDITINTFFHHRIKKVNRWAHFHYVFFELENEERDSINEKEAELHEVLWIKREDLKSFFSVYEGDFINHVLDEPDYLHTGDGILKDSAKFTGKDNREALWDIVASVGGERVTQYRIRDWLVSRQRYWGCPIPVVYDPEGKAHLIPPEHLPWLLPTDVDFTPTGRAPLATSKELHERVTKIFGEGWTPEYDTLDTFVDSSWYFLRYLDPKDDHDFSDASLMKKWLPVNRYSGGSEHTTMHLLYARFFVKALYDLALVPVSEPFGERFNRGLILGTDGQKMSKRWGNVVNPDEVVREFGTDAVRMYLAFIGPYNETGYYPWNLDGVSAMRKFLERVVILSDNLSDDPASEEMLRMLAKAEVKSAGDSERFKFNTALSALMVLVRDLEGSPRISKTAYHDLLKMLAPFAPHLAEELWSQTGGEGSVHQALRPAYEAELLKQDTVKVVVQVNGKRRGDVMLSIEATEEDAEIAARAVPAVSTALEGKTPSRRVYVPGKILNLVV